MSTNNPNLADMLPALMDMKVSSIVWDEPDSPEVTIDFRSVDNSGFYERAELRLNTRTGNLVMFRADPKPSEKLIYYTGY